MSLHVYHVAIDGCKLRHEYIYNTMHRGQHDKHEASLHETFINSSKLGETVFQMEEGAVKIPRLSRKYEIGRKFGKETAPPLVGGC